MCAFGVLWLSCEAPARSGGAAGVPHDNQRAQTCTFERPGLQKHHQNSTRGPPEREEKNEICGWRGKKRAKFWAVQGKGGPGEGRSREGRNQHPHMKPHSDTVKQYPRHTDNTQHNTIQHNTQQLKLVLAKVGFGQSRPYH